MCLSLLSSDSLTMHRWIHKAHWTVFYKGDNTCGWVPWTLQNEPGKDVASMHVEMLQNCEMIREGVDTKINFFTVLYQTYIISLSA